MKQKFTLLFVLALLLLASCKDNFIEIPTQPGAISNFVITATVGDLTKTTVVYGNTDYTAGEKSEWLAGDMIRVVFYNPTNGAEQYSARFVTTTSGSSAEFVYDSGTVPTGTAAFDIKAFYPADISDSATPVSISPFALGDGTSADNISPFDMMNRNSDRRIGYHQRPGYFVIHA